MQTTYRPRLRVPANWIDASASQELVAFAPLDEDEATMAVAAAEDVLGRAKLAAVQLRRIVVSSRTGTGFAPTLAAALGVPLERVEDGAAVLYGQTHVGNPGEGPVLQIQSDAPRPGRSGDAAPSGAHATARLAGPGVADDSAREISAEAVPIDREMFDRLAQWERDSPRRTTMGAYIPRATWDRSIAARYRLEAGACPDGHVGFPPHPRCAECGKATTPQALPRPGTVETFTIVAKGAGPSEYDPWQNVAGEYAVVVARFGACRVPGIWTDATPDRVRIGTRVVPVFRRLFGQDGEWRYGLKFRPG